MNKLIAISLTACALAFAGCSTSDPLNNLAKNLTAAQCSDQPGTLANIPGGFLTPAQQAQILASACNALYGSVAAPPTAAGNTPVFK